MTIDYTNFAIALVFTALLWFVSIYLTKRGAGVIHVLGVVGIACSVGLTAKLFIQVWHLLK